VVKRGSSFARLGGETESNKFGFGGIKVKEKVVKKDLGRFVEFREVSD
jgi:hypothetical protein